MSCITYNTTEVGSEASSTHGSGILGFLFQVIVSLLLEKRKRKKMFLY